jgi:hypothetical protein
MLRAVSRLYPEKADKWDWRRQSGFFGFPLGFID